MNTNQKKFLAFKKNIQRQSESSLNHYKTLFRLMNQYGFDEGTLCIASLEAFCQKLAKRKIQATTLEFYYKLLKHYLDYISRFGCPNLQAYIPEVSVPELLPRVITPQEIEAIYTYLPTHLWQIFLFMLETGVRKSEALNARWHQSGIISVIGKGQRQRLLPARRLPKISEKDLNDLMRHLQKVRKGIRLHDIRHTYAYTLLRNNVDIRTIQLLLGHKNINTTMIYLRLDISSIQSRIEDIDFLRSIDIPLIDI